MAAYDPELWKDFFVAAAGATAALIGLLFVAISINLDRILAFPSLPRRAVGTLGVLLSLLVVSSVSLAPGQSHIALGIEILLAGAVVTFMALRIALTTGRSPDAPPGSVVMHFLLLFIPCLALAVGGASLIAEAGGGLYWVLAALVMGFFVTVVNGWVLLVEIKR